MKMEAAATFILERARARNPSPWALIRRAGMEKDFGKTTLYDALNVVLRSGKIAKDGDLLWAITPETRDAWRTLADVLERWSIVRSAQTPIRSRRAAALTLGSMLGRLSRVPYSRDFLDELSQDLRRFDDSVYAAIIPLQQELLRVAAEGRFVGVPRGADPKGGVKDAIWPSLRERLARPGIDLEALIGCESLLLAFIRDGRLTSREVTWVASWLADDQLTGARDRNECMNRWQSLRPLVHELMRVPKVRRRLQLRFARVPEDLARSKPWLSELGVLLLSA